MHTRGSWLLQLYPRYWRVRYGDEFAAVLAACPLTPMTLLDVLFGALDAHIHPLDETGRILAMLNRPRRTAITVFCAYIGFVVAGLSFNQMVEDDINHLSTAHPDIGLTYHVVMAGAVVALLAVLVGGLPIALASARQALAAKRSDILLLYLVPPIALALWLAWTWTILNVIAPNHATATAQSTPTLWVFVSWIALFALAAVASTLAVAVAIARSQINPRLFRFSLWPATVATLAMLAMLGGVIAWGLTTRADDPAYFATAFGVWKLDLTRSWLAHVAAMALLTLIAIVALIRGYTSLGPQHAPGVVANAA